MKRIVIIVTRSDTLGGVQRHIIDLINQIKKSKERNYYLDVIAGESSKKLFFKELKKNNISFTVCPYLQREISFKKDLLSIIWLIKYIFKNKIDLIYSHSSKAGFIARIVATLTNTKVIFTVHGWSFYPFRNKFKKKIFIFIEYLLYHLTNKVILVSNYDYLVSKKYNFPIKKSYIIHNSVPIKRLEKTAYKKIHISKSIKILMVARLDSQKNHKLLFKALKFLENELNWELILAGDGPLQKELKDYSSTLNIDKKIKFIGFSSKVEELYRDADIFVLTSNWEGFPMTTIEAMRASLPIIITNIGGCSEAVIEGFNGYIIEHDDHKKLSNCLANLIRSKQLRTELGNNSYKLYKKLFSYKLFFNKTMSLIDSTLEV